MIIQYSYSHIYIEQNDDEVVVAGELYSGAEFVNTIFSLLVLSVPGDAKLFSPCVRESFLIFFFLLLELSSSDDSMSETSAGL